MEGKTTRVEIADHTGHTVTQMTRSEIFDLASKKDIWVFTNGQRIGPQQIAEDDWPSVGTVQVMPSIVFG